MDVRLARSLGFVVLASLLGACGADVQEDDGAGGFSSSTGTEGSGTGGGELACPELADVDAPPAVQFIFHNDSLEDVYLAARCGRIAGVVRPGMVDDEANFPWSAGCSTTCEDVQEGGGPVCDECDYGTVLLRHGETKITTWEPLSLVTADLPSGCAPDGEATTCQQLVAAPAGGYRLELMAHGACPECVCDEEGRCDGSPEAPSMLLDVAFELPTSTVDHVLPVCLFGCAGG